MEVLTFPYSKTCFNWKPAVVQVAGSAYWVHRELHRVVRCSASRNRKERSEPWPCGPFGVIRSPGDKNTSAASQKHSGPVLHHDISTALTGDHVSELDGADDFRPGEQHSGSGESEGVLRDPDRGTLNQCCEFTAHSLFEPHYTRLSFLITTN